MAFEIELFSDMMPHSVNNMRGLTFSLTFPHSENLSRRRMLHRAIDWLWRTCFYITFGNNVISLHETHMAGRVRWKRRVPGSLCHFEILGPIDG
jgi:hypothetical protein